MNPPSRKIAASGRQHTFYGMLRRTLRFGDGKIMVGG